MHGAFSTVLMTKDRVIAFRDPAGLRPLVLGRVAPLPGETAPRYCVASESCALDIIGAELVRDVRPGEIVSLSEEGLESVQVFESEREAVLRVRVHLLRAAGLADGRQRRCRSCAGGWARSSRARPPPTPTS